MLALPTDVAPMDNPACRTAVAAAIDRRAVQEQLDRPGQRGAQLPAVAEGPRRRTRRPRPAAGRIAPRAPRLRSAGTGRLRHGARRSGHADQRRRRRGGGPPAGRGGHRGGGPPAGRGHVLRHRRREPGERGGQRLRHHPHDLDGGLPHARIVPGAARRRAHHPPGRQHQLRAAERRGDQRARGPGAALEGSRRVARGRHGRGRDERLRAARRDPRPAGGRAAPAQRAGHAAVHGYDLATAGVR